MNFLSPTVVKCDGYSYSVELGMFNERTIEEAKKIFAIAQQKGVIVADSFWAKQWKILDESQADVLLDFRFDEVQFNRKCSPLLGCTAKDYDTAMRLVLTSYWGASVGLLRSIASNLCRMADNLDGNTFMRISVDSAPAIQQFLRILPGDTDYKNMLIDLIDPMIDEEEKSDKEGNYRTLCYYQTYLRFDFILNDFWRTASTKEKMLYFPIYLWWRLTAILPLRPIEFVLTPRNCITRENGKTLITIRRTKRKKSPLSAEYNIESDFEMEQYIIPEDLALDVEDYIEYTSSNYESPIDTLFCKNTLHRITESTPKTKRFLYRTLNSLLNRFQNEVVLSPRYGLTLRPKGETPLGDNEIELVSLGDTRHIAMISLMISGNSELVCQALAGHDIIETGQAYYGNVKTFVDALAWERVRTITTINNDKKLPTVFKVVDAGICGSPRYSAGDYSDCGKAVTELGIIGECTACPYLIVPDGKEMIQPPNDDRLKYAFIHVLDAIKKANNGTGLAKEVVPAVNALKAEANYYTHKKAMSNLNQKETVVDV